MTTTISIYIDDDVKYREEYVLNIHNATPDQVVIGILRVTSSALSAHKAAGTLEALVTKCLKGVETLKEALGEDNNSRSV